MVVENRDSETGRFVQGNRPANTEHGGAGAVVAIQRGEPMKGLAAQEERQVIEDLEAQGRSALVLENAVRLQTATRLYWEAVQTAADAGDLKKLDSYCARFGWLAGASLRAWAQVKAERPEGEVITPAQIIEASGGNNDDD